MPFVCAQERTCGVASGATTRTRPPASRRLAILDSATVPAPTTRHGRFESLRNIGKSFAGFMFSGDALLARAWILSLRQILLVIVLRVKMRPRGIRIYERRSGVKRAVISRTR